MIPCWLDPPLTLWTNFQWSFLGADLYSHLDWSVNMENLYPKIIFCHYLLCALFNFLLATVLLNIYYVSLLSYSTDLRGDAPTTCIDHLLGLFFRREVWELFLVPYGNKWMASVSFPPSTSHHLCKNSMFLKVFSF